MKKTIASFAAALMVASSPVVASAQSTGSLGSLGNDAAPGSPVEHEPNPRELETIAMLNEVIDYFIDRWSADENLTIVLERDAELSRLAQQGAELLLPKFVEFLDTGAHGYEGPNGNLRFEPRILTDFAPYTDSYVCGPAQLALDTIEKAYREPSFDGTNPDGNLRYNTSALLGSETPVAGVGYAEGQGFACSYLLQQSANYPFR